MILSLRQLLRFLPGALLFLAPLGSLRAQAPTRYCTTNLGGYSCIIAEMHILGTSLTSAGYCQSTYGSPYNYYPANRNGLSATLEAGATYQVQVRFNAVCSASLWLDANNNGTFEPSEWRLITAASPTSLSQTVTVAWTVPATAQLGRTRLRVRTSPTYSALGASGACTNTDGDTRDYPVQVVATRSSTVPAPYCAAPYQNAPTPYSAIQSVQLAGTTLSSRVGTPATVATAYQRFSATLSSATGRVARGQQYPLYVGMGSNSSLQLGAWVDWNQNQQFEVDEYQALPTVPSSGAYSTFFYTGMLTVPATAVLGTTRMRVRVGDAAAQAPQACATLAYGSAVDFTLTVEAAPTTPPPPAFNPAPAWQAARRDGANNSTDYHTGLAVDSASGATYVVGSFQNTIQIGSFSGTSGQGRDGFYLAKYDAAGTPQWVRTTDLNGTATYSAASTSAVAVDRQGNVFVTGRLSGTARFGPGVSVTTSIYGGAFLAKYSPTGTALWAQGVLGASSTGGGEVNLTGLTVDDQGYPSVSGSFYNLVGRATDGYLSRFSPQGTQVWLRTLSSSDYDRAPDIAALPGGDVVVLANYGLPFEVDNITVDDQGMALLRFSAATGALVWARTAIGPVQGTAIRYDRRNGGLLVAGTAEDGAIFDPGTGLLATTAGSFVAHYRPDGSLRWQRSAGTSITKLLPDGHGGAYLAGSATPLTRFGGIEVGGLPYGSSSLLVAYYDSLGTARWVATAPASTNSALNGLGLLPDGTLVAAGRFLGTLPLGSTTLTSAGSYNDAFLTRLRPACTVPVLGPAASVLCTGDTLRLLAQGAPAGATLQWTGPNAFSSTAAAPRVLAATGTYTLATTAPGGCTSTSTLAVSVRPRPATPTVQVSSVGGVFTLTSSAATGNQWYRNGQLVPGATGPSYVVSTAAQFGNYTVVTTSAGGCSSLPSGPLVVTASARAQATAAFELYPNPTPDGRVWVQRRRGAPATQLAVHNVLGETVRSIALPASDGNAQALDLRKLPAGIYVLLIAGPDGPAAHRLTVE